MNGRMSVLLMLDSKCCLRICLIRQVFMTYASLIPWLFLVTLLKMCKFLNVTSTHQICISNKDCKQGTIKVYDSLRTGDLPLSVKEVIAALVKCDKKIFLLFPDVQQQPNSSSCGLFALACASTLCEGKDRTKFKFDFPLMQIHFLSCLQNKKFTAFPSTSSMYLPAKPLSTSFKIYCVVVYQIGVTKI